MSCSRPTTVDSSWPTSNDPAISSSCRSTVSESGSVTTICSVRCFALVLHALDPALADRLHARASAISERQGDNDSAVRHAVAARDISRAADLVLRHGVKLVYDGRVALLGQWLGLLGAEAREQIPAAVVASAWYGIATEISLGSWKRCGPPTGSGRRGHWPTARLRSKWRRPWCARSLPVKDSQVCWPTPRS